MIGFSDYIPSNATMIDTSSINGQMQAYIKCNVVQDVINLKSLYHSNLKLGAQKESGDWIGGNYGTASEQKMAKQDLALLAKFNDTENFRAFNYKLKQFLHIFGEAYIWKMKVVGMNKYQYFIIPRQLISPNYGMKPDFDANFKPIPKNYTVTTPAGTMTLENDEVFVIGDGIAGMRSSQNYTSRLEALSESISALMAINEMFTELIQDGGARGIIGQGAKDSQMLVEPYLDEEKALMQKELKTYGKMRGQFKYLVTKGTASYVPLTSTITEMQLPENILAKKVDIYRSFGLPNAYAMNESRFKVMPESRKEAFTGSVTPEAHLIYDALIRMVGIPERDWIYTTDDRHMDFFQESLLQSGTALQQAANAVVPLVSNGIWSVQTANSELTPYMR